MRILRYLKGTTQMGILYSAGIDIHLLAFPDVDYAGDLDDRHTTLGYFFSLGCGLVCWCSKKQ
jgi:hypothetical protein